MAKSSYIAKSRASLEALKSANLLKSLNLTVLIYGEVGVGKKSLGRYIFEDAPMIDGASQEKLYKALELNEKLIITNFDRIKNFDKLKKIVEIYKNKIVATTSKEINSKLEDDFFSLKIFIPPLKERPEDVKALSLNFLEETKTLFGDLPKDLDIKSLNLDLSQNAHSLKRSIYKAYFLNILAQEDILEIFENLLYEKLEDGYDYKKLIRLFEVPLIKSGFKMFGSQLSMSKAFGINRNTLRKKIKEYDLQGVDR